MRSYAPSPHPLFVMSALTCKAQLQVDLPVNSRIEYKYVILEEQVCTAPSTRLLWRSWCFSGTGCLTACFLLYVLDIVCLHPAGLDETGE